MFFCFFFCFLRTRHHQNLKSDGGKRRGGEGGGRIKFKSDPKLPFSGTKQLVDDDDLDLLWKSGGLI